MTRALALASLVLLIACDPAPAQPAASAEAPPLMKRSVDQGDALPDSASPRERPPASAPTAKTGPQPEYDRKTWQHWVDDDHDCQDARTEVLISESYADVQFEDARKCEVRSGAWQCPYTGKLIKQAHLLDVDHLVPLSNAHRSGGASWDKARRRRYANDLSHPEHLVAVDYVANRSKGDKGPEAWLPPSEEHRCQYVREWVAVKQRWGLSMTAAEGTAVDAAFALCEAGKVPELPQGRAKPKPEASKAKAASTSKPDSPKECCRTCKSGKACGDSCIAQTSTCTKPPGCACDG